MAKRLCELDGCTRAHYALGLCAPHYNRNRKYGDPRGGVTIYGTKLAWLRATVADLVANPTNECVPHPFKRGAGPETSHYGSVRLNGRAMGMHRAALIIAGRKPAGRGGHTRHLCGNDRCVNPSHIVAGTGKENAADRERHGRTAYGAKIPQFHLTDDVIREIRSSSETNKAIAQRLGVDPSTISKIRSGQRRQRVK